MADGQTAIGRESVVVVVVIVREEDMAVADCSAIITADASDVLCWHSLKMLPLLLSVHLTHWKTRKHPGSDGGLFFSFLPLLSVSQSTK